MRSTFKIAALGLAAALLVAAPAAQAQMTTTPAAVQAGTYKLDPAHGKITWSITHFGFSTYVGQFAHVDATLKVDPKALGATALDVTIDNNSLGTLNIRGERSVVCRGDYDLHPSKGPLPKGAPPICEYFRQLPDALERAAELDAQYGRNPDLKKMPMYGVVFFLPQFLQTAQGHGPLGAGLRLLPWTATLIVFAPVGGALVNRIGERLLVVAGLILQAVGMAWIAIIVTPTVSYGQLVAPLLLAGAGVSMAMPAAQNAVLSSVGPSEVGKASGTFNMLRYLGGAFGIAILVAGFAHGGNFGSAEAFSKGFAFALGIAATLSFVGAIAGLGLPRGAAAVGADASREGAGQQTG